ncbi:MAG: 30S ribosomal protein S6, partial [Candidatus Zixiibacteriota bacterium]
ETVFVLDPSIDEKTTQKEIKRVKDLITGHKGQVLTIDKWGKKRFAYPIKKKNEGIYTLILFEGDGRIPKELDRVYKLNEFCLRYLTVLAQQEAEPSVSEGKEQEVKKDKSSDS